MSEEESVRLLTVEQAAKCLSISRSFAWILIREGQLRSVNLGRRRLIPVDALDELVGRSTTRSTEAAS